MLSASLIHMNISISRSNLFIQAHTLEHNECTGEDEVVVGERTVTKPLGVARSSVRRGSEGERNLVTGLGDT